MGTGITPAINYKLDVNVDCNLSSGSVCRTNGAPLSNATYNNGTNVTIDGSDNANLDSSLTSVNSTPSVSNTDLKLQSAGTGAIMLKANATYQTEGEIHLARMDSESVRFNTIECGNDSNDAYIKFLVHYVGGDNALTREVLNSDLSSTFAGQVSIAGKLVNAGGSRITIQNGVDGGTANGIAMWLNADSNWAIYMASPGANKSFAGGTAVAGYDFSLHAIRFRVNNYTQQGFIFENHSEQLCCL